MKDKMTNQNISGDFIFQLGMAMFTLLGVTIKANTIWFLYIIAIIIHFF
ncbi:hypothetical protein ICE98_00017 [Lactococcus lactis]|nr:hypothetical protein [Lactococcus lactis]